MVFGRNADYPPRGVLDRYGLVTIFRPEGKHAFASIGLPGLGGVISGMNEAGLAPMTGAKTAVATTSTVCQDRPSPRSQPRNPPRNRHRA